MTTHDRRGAEMLDAYRRVEGISQARVDTLSAAMLAKLPASIPETPATNTALTTHTPLASAKLWACVVALALPLAYLGWKAPSASTSKLATPAHTSQRVQAPTPGRTPTPDRTSTVAHVDAGAAAQPVQPAAPPRRAPTKAISRVRPRATPAASVPETEPVPVTIDAEVAALRDANLLLRSDPKQVSAALDAMDARFGVGALGDARTLTRVMALCKQGERSKARDVADAYLSTHGASPYAERMRTACPSE